jgi:hypothetical protein
VTRGSVDAGESAFAVIPGCIVVTAVLATSAASSSTTVKVIGSSISAEVGSTDSTGEPGWV